MLFQESIQSYPRRTRGMRCHFLLRAATEPVTVNNDKWPEDDEIPKHITKSHLSRVLMYCSTCQPTHTSSFTLWQLSQGFFFLFWVNNTQLHSLQSPAARVVLCQGTHRMGQRATSRHCCAICDSTGLSEHLRKGNCHTGGMLVPGLAFQRAVGSCGWFMAWHSRAWFVQPTVPV